MNLNYSNSGIITLRIASKIYLIVSVITAFMLIPTWSTGGAYGSSNWIMIGLSFMIIISGIFTFGLGYSIATIAENALWEKQKKEFSEIEEKEARESKRENDIKQRYQKSGNFSEGDLVVLISTGKQMRVKTIVGEGKYACYTNNGTILEGYFDETEIELFKNNSKR